jgi:serine protease Do
MRPLWQKVKGEGRKAKGNQGSLIFRLWSSPFTLRSSPFCVCLLIGFCLLHATTLAQAPSALPAAIERPGVVDPEKRAALRRELERHAEVLDAQSAVLKIVAKLVGPSVVHIAAEVPPIQYDQGRHIEEHGSGVIVEFQEKYYVLTNWHVIHDATPDAIRIKLADGRVIHPVKILEDPETDVAVMPVSAADLVAAPVGNSDRIETGDFVLALGSPFGLTNSVTFGIISARGRWDLHLPKGTIHFQDFLQTDAAINPGNSGGPLVNLRGELIGINDSIASDSGTNEGVGFSIPINLFMTVGRQLITTGKVARAFLGVNLNSKFGPATAAEVGLPRPMGAQVTAVTPGSPADAAKLRPGDVILEFNGKPIEDDAHLVNIVSLTEVGKTVPLLVFRDRKPFTVTVEVADRSKFGP